MDELLANLPAWAGGATLGATIAARKHLLLPRIALVEVRGLEHTYLAGTPLAHLALNGVDLEVQKGRSHGLVGVTGSGKSTLLQHLNGLLRPQKGTVRVGPYQLEDPQVLTREVTHIAGLVMQNPEMQFFEQYVGDEIAYGPRQMKLDRTAGGAGALGDGTGRPGFRRVQGPLHLYLERRREAQGGPGLDPGDQAGDPAAG